MAKTSLTTADEPSAQSLPVPWVRTTLSFLIFVHLFAVATALVGLNPGFSSGLTSQVARVFSPYLRLFDLDSAYAYALTRAETFDIDHALEIDLKLADGTQRTVRLPEADLWPRSRAHRYQMLAYNIGANNDDQLQGILPSGLGLALVDQNQAVDATVKCRGHSLLDWTQSARGDDPNAAALWRQEYAA